MPELVLEEYIFLEHSQRIVPWNHANGVRRNDYLIVHGRPRYKMGAIIEYGGKRVLSESRKSYEERRPFVSEYISKFQPWLPELHTLAIGEYLDRGWRIFVGGVQGIPDQRW